jgi:LysM repeat protein
MKSPIWILLFGSLALLLSACSNVGDVASSNHPTGTGPFDSAGNYREEWADDPSKWRRPGKPEPRASDDTPVIAKNEQPPADSTPITSSSSTRSKPETKSVKVAVSKSQESDREIKTNAVAETPKPTVAKPKPKVASTRYTIKKGDSLSTIAARNGTSVAAIKRANGISGTMIREGQKLTIPKR